MANWRIFQGNSEPHDIGERLPPPPPWRDFSKRDEVRGSTFQAAEREIEIVNAALYLRRPLLVTGNPGNGKSSLAYAVARELSLGQVLRWSINSRSTRQQGLYQYDALARLRDHNLAQRKREQTGDDETDTRPEDIGQYIRLGPLGTALLPRQKPRVLLIDEIDKSDIDLPNDLLHVFEEGEFEISELVRRAEQTPNVRVLPIDGQGDADKVEISGGRVRCNCFPLVFLTSNGERDFPPAFLRRCLRLDIGDPEKDKLHDIIAAHLQDIEVDDPVKQLIDDFVERRNEGRTLATDQLLNAIFLITRRQSPKGEDREHLLELVLRELGN